MKTHRVLPAILLCFTLSACLSVTHRVNFTGPSGQRAETLLIRAAPNTVRYLEWLDPSIPWCNSLIRTAREDTPALRAFLSRSRTSQSADGLSCSVTLAPQPAHSAPRSRPREPIRYIISRPDRDHLYHTHRIHLDRRSFHRSLVHYTTDYVIWRRCLAAACQQAPATHRDRCPGESWVFESDAFDECIDNLSFAAYESQLVVDSTTRRSLAAEATRLYTSIPYLLHIHSPVPYRHEPPLERAMIPPEDEPGGYREWRDAPRFQAFLRGDSRFTREPAAPWGYHSRYLANKLGTILRQRAITWHYP